MQPDNVEGDLAHVLLTEEQISDRIAAIAAEIDEAYQMIFPVLEEFKKK